MTSDNDDTERLPDEKKLSELAAFANDLADTAREAILPYWRNTNEMQIDHKFEEGRSICQVESPVTVADRLAEKNMRALIESKYPDHGICGEEYGTKNKDADYLWVLDPIDGTKSFITGKPLFGTLIACLFLGNPVVGIIDQCVLKERWVGVSGKPSTLNGKPINTNKQCDTLSKAMLFATTPDMFNAGYEKESFAKISKQCKYTNFGTDCYAYALVASGFEAHIVMEADLGLYDYCALVPVIHGAGGIISDWNGNKLTLQNHEACKGRILACATKKLQEQVLEILKDDAVKEEKVGESNKKRKIDPPGASEQST